MDERYGQVTYVVARDEIIGEQVCNGLQDGYYSGRGGPGGPEGILITEGKGGRGCKLGRIQELSDKDTF